MKSLSSIVTDSRTQSDDSDEAVKNENFSVILTDGPFGTYRTTCIPKLREASSSTSCHLITSFTTFCYRMLYDRRWPHPFKLLAIPESGLETGLFKVWLNSKL